MNVAIIPARGGSTRVPRKNIRPFAGQPIISWSILAAINSGCFDQIIVSTDDDEIADIAVHYGAEVPFRRPDDLASNHAGTMPVIRHAAQWLISEGAVIDRICCIYATAPFISPADIQSGLHMLDSEGCKYAFPVTSFASPIQRALKIDARGRVSMFQPDQFHSRSQDVEEAFHDAAQFWWGTASAWLEELPVYSPAACSMRIPRYRVQDIDTLEDWRHAELLFQALNGDSQ